MWKIVESLRQGSPEWIAHRAQHLNASDAPAMMACHPSKSRSELVRELATGIGREFSDFVQERVLDKGHEFERLAGPLMEELAGESLYPVVGVNGKFGASYDGLAMFENVAAEHKRLNAALREAMTPGCAGGDLPLCYQVQMEHQAMVCPTIERILFVASDWDDRGGLIEERHCWYVPNPQLRAQILAGWELLERDVAAYTPPAIEPTTAKIHAALPALRVEASGQITASNLEEFQAVVLDRINSVNMELTTDQHFADGDADAKWLRDVSSKMKEAVLRVRGGMQSVDDVLRVLEQLDDIATKKAIAIEKKVKTEKDARKEQIVVQAEQQLAQHVGALNQKLGANYLPPPARGVFAAVTKGLKSLSSMEDKVRAALAVAMAEADATAERLAANREHLRQEDADWIALFADFATVGTKAGEDFQAIAALRIGQHRQAEAKRLEAREKLIQAEAQAQAGIAAARQEEALPGPLLDDLSAVARYVRDDGVADIDARRAIGNAQASSAAAPPVMTCCEDGPPGGICQQCAQTSAAYSKDMKPLVKCDGDHAGPACADPECWAGPTITLGQINTLLAPIKLDAAGLEALGFATTRVKAAVHLPAAHFPKLCRAVAGRALAAIEKGIPA